jgi:hypothetical protein
MKFYPEDRLPKPLNKVLDSSGEQYNISDPRYSTADDLENTKKIPNSSTDDYFATPDAAEARAQQIGCGGYHIVVLDGVTYYRPCESADFYTKRRQQLESPINFQYIGNYRIISWDNPFIGVTKFNGWLLDTANSSDFNEGSSINPNSLLVEFRYSIDGESWSLWTSVGTALSNVSNTESEIFSIDLDPAEKFYPEFRLTSVLINPDGTLGYLTDEPVDPSVVVLDFDMDLTYDGNYLRSIDSREVVVKPAPRCSDQYSNRPVIFAENNFTFNPYAVNRALNLYQDLSRIVNKLFGFEVNYYSVQPQARGRDVILKEYTLFNVVDEKCIKVMVNNNQFPDNKINYDPFGLQFDEPFEIQIDRRYFGEIFGNGAQPRKRDIIYFPLTNRIYEINSTYLFRDFMNSPVYFKIELKKYQPKSNTFFQDPAYKEELEGISISTQDLFGAEIKSEEEKVTKPQQYVTTTYVRSTDPTRSYLYEDLSIVGFDLNNNWTIILNNYYDLESSFVDRPEFTFDPFKNRNVIRYKTLPKLGEKEEICLTSWFSLRNAYDDSKLRKIGYPTVPTSVVSYTDEIVTYTTHPYKHNLRKWEAYSDNPDGYVAIQGDASHSGGYKVLEVIDEYTFTVENVSNIFDPGILNWKMQKAQSRNFLSGLYFDSLLNYKGFRFDLIHSGAIEQEVTNFIGKGSFYLRLNDLEVNSPLQFQINYGEWYAIVVNVSNKYRQLSIHAWKLSYDAVNPLPQTSELTKVHEYVQTLTNPILFDAPTNEVIDVNSPFYGTEQNSYKIFSSPLYLSNIRLFKNMIDIDNQSTVLNQNVVRDSQLAHIIDNAKPLLNVPKVNRSR